MNKNIMHLCLQNFPRSTECILRKPVLVKGVLLYAVSCPLCKRDFIVNSQGQVLK